MYKRLETISTHDFRKEEATIRNYNLLDEMYAQFVTTAICRDIPKGIQTLIQKAKCTRHHRGNKFWDINLSNYKSIIYIESYYGIIIVL